MSKKYLLTISIVVVFTLSACAQSTPTSTPASQTGNLISGCQTILEPGNYSLASDLMGATVEISEDLGPSAPYTGNGTLTQTCIKIASSDVRLDCQGHELTGSGEEDSGTVGIYVTGREEPLSDIQIQGCTVVGYQIGLFGGFLEGGEILRNEAWRNSSIGFLIVGSTGLTLSENVAVGNDPDGILILASSDIQVSNNMAFYNRMRGITFDGCNTCVVTGNESHSHGVLGFGIYASKDMLLENNIAYDNRYHGFAILHEAGSATFRGNMSYENDRAGFYMKDSQNNQYLDNVSKENALDGIAIFGLSYPLTLENNTLQDNGGYGLFSDSPIEDQISAGNTYSGNTLGETGNLSQEEIDNCKYTGFGTDGPCDPVFEGGPNLKDPEGTEGVETPSPDQDVSGGVIAGARIEGDPIYLPTMGDLWMPTWADDDRLYLTWGDGIGFGEGYPVGYPDYESLDPINPTFCQEDEYTPEKEGYFPCWLWCNVTSCDPTQNYPPAPLTDAGVMALEGPVPNFEQGYNVSIDVPTGEPFFLAGPNGTLDVSARNDKPSSLLFLDGRLVLAGHSPAGMAETGYLAVSDSYGQTWTEIPGSPWGDTSNFRVMMFVNMGQDYSLNQDGYVYAYGVGTEASWTQRTVYLARVPKDSITDYDAYEYFSGMDGNEPGWSSNETDAIPLDNLYTTGQASAMYHEGTGRYLFLTTDINPPDGPAGSGALYEALEPWGPWREAAVLCFLPECDDGSYSPAWTDGKYIAGLIPKGAGSDYVYFTIAGGDLHYQLQIGKLVFDINP